MSSERACRRCAGRGCLGILSHKCLSDRGNNNNNFSDRPTDRPTGVFARRVVFARTAPGGNNNNFSDRPTDRLESSPGGWSSPEPPQEATTTTFPTDRLSYLSYRLALDCIPAPCLQGHVNKPGIAHRARVRGRRRSPEPWRGVEQGRHRRCAAPETCYPNLYVRRCQGPWPTPG